MKKCMAFLLLLLVSLFLSNNLYAYQSDSLFSKIVDKFEIVKSKLFGNSEVDKKEIVNDKIDETKIVNKDLTPEKSLSVEQPNNNVAALINNKNLAITNIFAKGATKRKVIISDKKSRTLFLVEISGDNIVILDQYPAIYGSNNGDKYVVGDNKTPEGIYYVTGYLNEQNLKNRFRSIAGRYGTGAFPLNYPNPFDKMRGKTGGGIWLHGNSIAQKFVTQGCIAIENSNIDELKNHIDIGTPVILAESINYQTAENYSKKRASLLTHIDEIISMTKLTLGSSDFKISDIQLYTHDEQDYALNFNIYNCSNNRYAYDNMKYYFTVENSSNKINIIDSNSNQLDVSDLKYDSINPFINNWAAAWQSQDIDTYINFYSPSFRSSNRNYNQYKKYKTALFRPKNKISVNMDIVDIWISKDNKLYVKMKQQYSSQLVKDTGYKTLQLVGCNGNYLIVSERWSKYE